MEILKPKKSVYIHIPFCAGKCRYCDYFTVKDKNGYIYKYLESIKKEASFYRGQEIKTIYIGGGTPSLLDCPQFEKLIEIIEKNFDYSASDVEFSLELNPDSINEEKLRMYKENGVNRITIGIQSFNDKILNFLGRIYSVKKARQSIEFSMKYFKNINIDLLFAIPEIQKLTDIENDLQIAGAYEFPHIAIYNLVIENRTYFHWLMKNNKISEIDDELYEKEYKLINSILTSKNYVHYELSSFAKKGFECRHNLTYWRNQEYIGLGAGAHSYISGKRFWNVKFPSEYIIKISENKSAVEDYEILESQARLGETIMLRLHLEEGVDIDEVSREFKINFKEKFSEELEKLLSDEYIIIKDNIIRLTLKGKLFANVAARSFL